MNTFTNTRHAIALYTRDPWGSAVVNIRVVAPAAAAGLHVVDGFRLDESSEDAVSQVNLVVIQRNFPGKWSDFEQVVRRSRLQGKPVIYEVDDLLFELPHDHPARHNPDYHDAIMPMLETLIEADAVTVSTPALADYLRPYNANTWLLPNYLNDELWSLKPPQAISEEPSLVIGYMGGGTHGPDLDLVTPALLNILRKYRQAVTLRLWGGEPPAALLYEPNVIWTPVNLIDYAEFAHYASQQNCQIAIAPLVDSQFNRCKSALKFLEYSALGLSGVYSRVEPYAGVIVHGENGFMASTTEEWEQYLTYLIERPADRAQMAQQAAQTVQRDWLLSRNATRWAETYQQIMADYVPRPLNSPAALVAKRMVRHHAEVQQEIHQAFTENTRELKHRHQQEIQKLLDNTRELNNRIWALNGLLNEKEHAVQTLAAIQNGLSWQLMMKFWKLMAVIAPPDSRRERLLRTFVIAGARSLGTLAQVAKRLLGPVRRRKSTATPDSTVRAESPALRLNAPLSLDAPETPPSPIFESPRLLTPRCFRVLYITVDPDLHSHRYRVDNYRESLSSVGVATDMIRLDMLASRLQALPRYDIVVVFRAVYNDLLAQAYAICRKAGVPIVYDVDDYIFDSDIVTEKYVDGIRFLSTADQQAYAASVPKYRQALLEADYCTVSTAYLAARCRDLGQTAFMLANGLNQSVIQLSANARQPASAEDDEIRIGYFSGTKTHQRDFAVAAEPIARLMSEQMHLKLVVVGELDLAEFPILQPFADRIEQRPFVAWQHLPAEIARVDINIVPLEIGNPYCEAKSELKYFESAVVNVPTVASTTESFQAAIRDGKTGFLASNGDEWYTALRTLVTDRSLRQAMAAQAHDQVLSTYDPVTLGVAARSTCWSVLNSRRARLNRSDTALAISFVLPPFLLGSGGHNKVLAVARGLAKRGHEVRLYVDGTGPQIESSLGILRQSDHLDHLKFSGSITDLVACDALIATHWPTAYLVRSATDFAARTFYFVQDYEPYFYPMGEGGVDFPAIMAYLKSINWRGHLNVELDTSPWRTPKESARITANYIRNTLKLEL